MPHGITHVISSLEARLAAGSRTNPQDVRALIAEVRRLRAAFDAMAGQRDHWMEQHLRSAARLAHIIGGAPLVMAAVDILLKLFHEDSYAHTLLLAVRRGILELHEAATGPRDTCAEAPPAS